MSLKQIWAPWRMEFITDPKTGGSERACVFCSLPQQNKDRENLILYRGKKSFIIMNKYPYNNGHLMIVPNRHLADYLALESDEMNEMNVLSKRAIQAIQSAYGPQGFNLGMNLGSAAGAGIKDHLHLHIVPRWVGDTNFMPVIGETKAMPQHLLTGYDSLFEHLGDT